MTDIGDTVKSNAPLIAGGLVALVVVFYLFTKSAPAPSASPQIVVPPNNNPNLQLQAMQLGIQSRAMAGAAAAAKLNATAGLLSVENQLPAESLALAASGNNKTIRSAAGVQTSAFGTLSTAADQIGSAQIGPLMALAAATRLPSPPSIAYPPNYGSTWGGGFNPMAMAMQLPIASAIGQGFGGGISSLFSGFGNLFGGGSPNFSSGLAP